MSASDFQGLPMEELIGAPLIAAGNAQTQLAAQTADFINNVGMDGNDKIRTVDFGYKKKNSDGSYVENNINVPLLAIVNAPNLRVKKVNVNFNMEVSTQDTTTDKTDMEAKMEAKIGIGPFSAKVSGKISSHKEHTRETDKSAKYEVAVEAADDGPPEGLARILNMMNNMILEETTNDKAAREGDQAANDNNDVQQ